MFVYPFWRKKSNTHTNHRFSFLSLFSTRKSALFHKFSKNFLIYFLTIFSYLLLILFFSYIILLSNSNRIFPFSRTHFSFEPLFSRRFSSFVENNFEIHVLPTGNKSYYWPSKDIDSHTSYVYVSSGYFSWLFDSLPKNWRDSIVCMTSSKISRRRIALVLIRIMTCNENML